MAAVERHARDGPDWVVSLHLNEDHCPFFFLRRADVHFELDSSEDSLSTSYVKSFDAENITVRPVPVCFVFRDPTGDNWSRGYWTAASPCARALSDQLAEYKMEAKDDFKKLLEAQAAAAEDMSYHAPSDVLDGLVATLDTWPGWPDKQGTSKARGYGLMLT